MRSLYKRRSLDPWQEIQKRKKKKKKKKKERSETVSVHTRPSILDLARHFHGRWEENNDGELFTELIDLTSL